MKGVPQPGQSAAGCRLTETQPLGRTGNVPFCEERVQRNEQIEVEAAEIHLLSVLSIFWILWALSIHDTEMCSAGSRTIFSCSRRAGVISSSKSAIPKGVSSSSARSLD